MRPAGAGSTPTNAARSASERSALSSLVARRSRRAGARRIPEGAASRRGSERPEPADRDHPSVALPAAEEVAPALGILIVRVRDHPAGGRDQVDRPVLRIVRVGELGPAVAAAQPVARQMLPTVVPVVPTLGAEHRPERRQLGQPGIDLLVRQVDPELAVPPERFELLPRPLVSGQVGRGPGQVVARVRPARMLHRRRRQRRPVVGRLESGTDHQVVEDGVAGAGRAGVDQTSERRRALRHLVLHPGLLPLGAGPETLGMDLVRHPRALGVPVLEVERVAARPQRLQPDGGPDQLARGDRQLGRAEPGRGLVAPVGEVHPPPPGARRRLLPGHLPGGAVGDGPAFRQVLTLLERGLVEHPRRRQPPTVRARRRHHQGCQQDQPARLPSSHGLPLVP